MRILGLDLGTKTLGLAITDKSNTLASVLGVLKFNEYKELIPKLRDIISEKNITLLVLGLPKNMDNSLGFAAQRSLNFKRMLEEHNIKVILEDERLTTVEALNIMKNNGMKKINKQEKTDILAAVLILENFLKRIENEKK